MSRSSRKNTKLAEIQQLCCLGLTSETALPQVMPLMREWLHADIAHFHWVDSTGAPTNYHGDVTLDDATVRIFFGNYHLMSLPGFRSFDEAVRTVRSVAFGGKDDPSWHSTLLYQQVMRPLSGECVLGLVVRAEEGPVHGCFALQRSSGHFPFTAEEQRQGEQMSAFLSLLFRQENHSVEARDHCVEQGMAIFATDGTLEHQEESARKLILMAQHERVDTSLLHARWQEGLVHQRILRLCAELGALFAGRPSSRPVFQVNNAWGRFVFHGHWLDARSAGERPRICVTVSHFVPIRLALWRRLATMGLTARQQQICLEFAGGLTLSQIAEKTGLSRHTVIDHVNRLYELFGLEPGRERLLSFLLDDEGPWNPGGFPGQAKAA